MMNMSGYNYYYRISEITMQMIDSHALWLSEPIHVEDLPIQTHINCMVKTLTLIQLVLITNVLVNKVSTTSTELESPHTYSTSK